MKEYQVELLAPAGNVEAFLGAIHAGADAVYLGGNKYGARAYADNFSTEELVFCIRYAHLFGRKVYLTVNTLMKDEEISELGEYIKPFYEAGLDACIVQDFGAFMYLKQNFPQMELHASTQMTITGAHSAQLLKEMGATRIVPARELSLKEIKYIKDATGLEIETFIHGAMCYCYSGQCLFSSILGGRSGNRGRCAQPCRLPYQVTLPKDNISQVTYQRNRSIQTVEEYYPLSLKDMCTIEHIDVLMDAGIDSFKIEGRMKKPEYSAGVTAIYRKYIDLKKKHPDKPLHFDNADLQKLSRLYIRSERQDGYYFKQNGGDMVTLENPAYSGSDEELLKEIRSKYIDTGHKMHICVYASVILGEKISVTFLYNDISVTVEGDVAEEAKNMPLSTENIKKQLKKLGDTCFEIVDINVYTDGKCFCSIKSLNELRRKAIVALEDEIIKSYGLCVHRKAIEISLPDDDHTPEADHGCSTGWTIIISNPKQYEALWEQMKQENMLAFQRIYLESELVLAKDFILQQFPEVDYYIALPYVFRQKDEAKLKNLLETASKIGFKGFLVRNLEEYAFLKANGYIGEIRTDAGIYIWNKAALSFWQSKVSGIHCPIELNRREWKSLFDGHAFEKLVYGRLPMMVTANCVAKTTKNCLNGNETSVAFLTDRYKKQFPVTLVCKYCMNIIYNSVPVSLHKDIINTVHEYDKKLHFTVETKEETKAILNFYKNITEGQLTEPPFKDYTTGHEKRGVL